MQEEVTDKTVAVAIKATKLSGRALQSALRKILAQWEKSRASPKVYKGRQTVKQLAAQGRGMSSIDVNDGNIRDFSRVARKYGVDFAPYKAGPGKYYVFFKAPDADAMTAAFTEYAARKVKRQEKEKSSLLAQLAKFKELAKGTIGRVKNREKGEREL